MGRGSGASTAQGQEAKATNGKQNYEYAEIVTKEPHITWFAAFTTYLGYAVLILLGRVRDLVGRFFGDLAAPTPPPSVMTAHFLDELDDLYLGRQSFAMIMALVFIISGS